MQRIKGGLRNGTVALVWAALLAPLVVIPTKSAHAIYALPAKSPTQCYPGWQFVPREKLSSMTGSLWEAERILSSNPSTPGFCVPDYSETPMQPQPCSAIQQQINSYVGAASFVLGVAALIAAPFTGGVSLALYTASWVAGSVSFIGFAGCETWGR